MTKRIYGALLFPDKGVEQFKMLLYNIDVKIKKKDEVLAEQNLE